jgi:hypothetical protein
MMSLPERYRQLREEGKATQAGVGAAEERVHRRNSNSASARHQGDAEQSWKSASGKAFEEIVWQEFSAQCQGLKDLQVATVA